MCFACIAILRSSRERYKYLAVDLRRLGAMDTAILPAAMEQIDTFRALVGDVGDCTACERMHHCHVLSTANGPLDARVIFIAEAVGRRGGAVTGVPLTRDESGRRFAALLEYAGLARTEVFVTNAVLCNPLDADGRNRRPASIEVARCRPFLERTIDIIAAPVVVALGRVALDALATISPHQTDLRRDAGTPLSWHGRTLVPMYHPSRQALLHRPAAAQRDDWRRLGAIARAASPPCSAVSRFVPAHGGSYHDAG